MTSPDFPHGLSAREAPNQLAQSRVVFLVNFLSPNLVEVMREAARGLGRLDVVVSVPMEANRNWAVDHAGLSVIIQKTWTKRRLAHHPGGYDEELFVHIPLDTFGQLRQLKPDCIVSLEMGVRSIQSSLYRRLWNRKCRHVLAVYGSERSEAGRGWLRRAVRRRLLRAVDVVTYNGPSCYRYLVSQGAPPDAMLPWDYAADPLKPHRGALQPVASRPMHLLTVSQLIPRKGVDRAALALKQWALEHPDTTLVWTIAGTGPQSDWFHQLTLPGNFHLQLLGHRDSAQLKQLYAETAINFFPTLGDEWGLVVDEALHSGQVVLGSIYSQAVETLVQPGVNGWTFDPEDAGSLHAALNRILELDDAELHRMRGNVRQSVAARTHVQSGQQFLAAVARALERSL